MKDLIQALENDKDATKEVREFGELKELDLKVERLGEYIDVSDIYSFEIKQNSEDNLPEATILTLMNEEDLTDLFNHLVMIFESYNKAFLFLINQDIIMPILIEDLIVLSN